MFLVAWILATSAADVSNERIPVSGAELEQHWHLDCGRVLDVYNNRIVPEPVAGKSEITTGELRDLADIAQKCSFIYNQKDTGRTISCPDYQRITDVLKDLVSKHNATRPAVLQTEKCGSD